VLFPCAHYRCVSIFRGGGFTLGTYLEVELDKCALRITDSPRIRHIPARSSIFVPCQPDFDLFLYKECALTLLWKSYAPEIQVGDDEFDSTFYIRTYRGTEARRFLCGNNTKELLLDIFSDSCVQWLSVWWQRAWYRHLIGLLFTKGENGIFLDRLGLLDELDKEKESLTKLIKNLVALRMSIASRD